MDHTTLFKALLQFANQQRWQYLYPVYSRRAAGISIGINLHPNQVCNWQCIYCQVSGLHRGASPHINLDTLAKELATCLDWLTQQLMPYHLPMQRMVSDIAFAGDGEPTTSPQFAQAVDVLAAVLSRRSQQPANLRLITNGSQIQHPEVQQALGQLARMHGEVWFKLDAGTDDEMRAINDSALPLSLHLKRLASCGSLCRTWIQTAVVHRRTADDSLVTSPALPGYLQALTQVNTQIAGVLLYGIARSSMQASASALRPLPAEVLSKYAQAIADLGITVRTFA